MSARRGFTLIELLVVISIIAILSSVGLVTYNGIRGKTLESKRKADIDSIKKAYETKYDPTLFGGQGGYKPLEDKDFSSGKIPSPYEGGSYFISGPNSVPATTTAPNFALCAPLKEGVTCPSPNQGDCSCTTSTQGIPVDPGVVSVATCDSALSNGLIGYWNFDEGTGSEVVDKMGGRSGIWNGTLGSHWVKGKIGKAGNFNGSNNYVEIPPNYNRTTGLSAVTVGAWIFGTGGRIINRGTNDILFQLFGGKLQVFINNGNPGVGTTNQVVSSNGWTHVAFTWSTAGGVAIFVNGNAVSVSGNTAVSTINDSGASNLRFGAYANDGTVERFTGLIDDVRIYNRALSAPEVVKLYNGNNGCVS